ncbi:MAG: MFS transporter [Pseudomonadota bacterium]
MATQAEAAPAQQSVRAVLWILLIVYIFNFIDRQIVNILAEPIRLELGLSDTQIGLMTGLAFALFYTVLGIPIARYADRPTSRRPLIIAVALAIWSGMTAISGMAQNFGQLLLARIGVGVGEAGCTPAAHSLIADMVPKEKRSSALAFYALGIPIGGLLGLVIGGLLADWIGWRLAFVAVGLPGVGLALLVLAVLKEPRRTGGLLQTDASRKTLGGAETLKAIFGSKALVLLIAGGSFAAFLAYGKVTWTTIFFQRTHGLTPGEVGLWFGLVNGLAGAAGTYLGGWVADKYGAVNRRHVLTAPAIGMAIAAPAALFAYSLQSWELAMVVLIIPTVCNSLYYGPFYSSVQGLVPLSARAMASAVTLFCQNLIGLGLGPLFFGMMSDWLKPEYGEGSVQIVLYAGALLGLLPAFFFWRGSLRLNEELDQKD